MKKRIAALLLALGVVVCTPSVSADAAGFVPSPDGLKVMYMQDDGSYLVDSWVQVGQSIYRLGADGSVQFGWIQVGDLWYYMDNTGVCTNPEGSAVAPAGLTQAAPAPAASSAQSAPAASTAETQPVTEMVWLSATGNKYHSINNCGNMNPKNARQVTLSEALERGMEKCSKCW